MHTLQERRALAAEAAARFAAEEAEAAARLKAADEADALARRRQEENRRRQEEAARARREAEEVRRLMFTPPAAHNFTSSLRIPRPEGREWLPNSRRLAQHTCADRRLLVDEEKPELREARERRLN